MSAPSSPGRGLTNPRVFGWGVLASLVTAAVAQSLAWWGFEERALGSALEGRTRPTPEKVRVVLIDELTWDKLGRLLSRNKYAQVVDALREAGVAAVGFDLVFERPATEEPGADEALGAALRRMGQRAVMAVDCYGQPNPRASAVPAAATWGPGPTPALRYGGVGVPIPQLMGSNRLAQFLLANSASGTYRSVVAVMDSQGRRYPGLSLATYAAARGLTPEQVVQEPTGLRLGDRWVPVDSAGAVPFSLRKDFITYKLEDLAEAIGADGKFDQETAEQLAGTVLLVGLGVDSSADYGPLVTGMRVPLILGHASMVADLLEGRVMRDETRGARAVAALLAGLLLTVAALGLQMWRGVLALTTLVLGSFAATVALAQAGWYVGPLGPIVAGTVAWIGTTGARLAVRERERGVLREAFGAYVDPLVLQRIMAEPTRFLSLSGARKVVTVLFCDVVGFTRFTNRNDPETVVAVLRDYLSEMTGAVVKDGGRVDKIMGDGILAVFGDPIDLPDHPRAAVRAALEMRRRLVHLGVSLRARGLEAFRIRIGVATGEVYVGNVGARTSKLEYTVLGAVVNLASRLEGKAPQHGVLVSRATRDACEGPYELVPAPPLSLKGFDEPQEAWLLLGDRGVGERQQLRITMSAPARLKVEGQWREVLIRNASTGGVFVETDQASPIGAAVELEVAGLQLQAEVRWRGALDGVGGLGLATHAESAHLLALLGVK